MSLCQVSFTPLPRYGHEEASISHEMATNGRGKWPGDRNVVSF
ncbi:hypothetical protein RB8774 [Rhodopirellula baltica SH 1]|uniref:Uncharacterized protein n=1 Tax=Rhodopirellula baltica (strain DSM 10527 / NCIMB 13988 / SH1) TaxID=243090 RepID=Q7UMK5_RHOBA|nr:hypothetical protein RB8774 [Rhodopirellula baltica SH 1]